ncbi:hypothetical protein HYU45_03165 [Candidatus Daviesbacteria bacterium]|nr:hypothetical protein [Candidatus Daviesbacteria bacterium]
MGRTSPENKDRSPFKTEGPDLIFVDPGLNLPEGMTTADIRDALNQARAFERQTISYDVFIREKLERNGLPKGGGSWGSSGFGFIELSVDSVRMKASDLSIPPGYTPAPASQQMWAAAFEEALHAARQVAGKDHGGYFTLPVNPTEKDWQRYLSQKQEAVVDKALNGGMLEAKFGRGVIYLGKRVLYIVPVLDHTIEKNKKFYPSSRDILYNLPCG